MAQGNFFVLDENSELDKGHVAYYYKAIKTTRGAVFPVFLTFTEDKVIFYFDGYVVKRSAKYFNEEEKEDSFILSNNNAKNLLKIKPKLELIGFEFASFENGIIRIKKMPICFYKSVANKTMPDHTKVNDFFYKLSANISNVSEIIAPFLPYEQLPTTELFTLHLHNDKATQEELKETINGVYNDTFPFIEEYKIDIEASQEEEDKIKSYRDLACFDNTRKEDIGVIYLKDILLDFLFDVYQPDEVFYEAAHFSKIKHLLKSSPLIQSIARKANFYYQIENYSSNNTVFTFKNNCFSNDIKKAQKEWLEKLQEKDSNKIIKGIEKEKIKEDDRLNSWFQDVETETKDVLNAVKDNIVKENPDDNTNFTSFVKDNLKLKIKTLDWFITRNNILYAWFALDKLKYVFAFILIFILFAVSSVVFQYNDSGTTKYFLLVPFIIFCTIKFTCFWDWLTFLIKQKNIWNKIKDNIKYSLNWVIKNLLEILFTVIKLFMLRLWWLIIGSSWIVFKFTSFYNKNLVNNRYTYQFGFVLLLALYFIIIYKLLRLTLRKNNIDAKEWLWSILIIIIIGIFIYSDQILLAIILPLVILAILFFVLYHDEKEIHPNLIEIVSKQKTFSMLFYALVISFLVNIIMYNTYYKEFLEQYEYLGQIWEHTTIHGDEKIITFESHHESQNKEKDIKNESTSPHTEEGGKLAYYYYVNDANGDNMFNEIKEMSRKPLSDEVNVYIDKYFFDELTNVHLFDTDKNKKLYPVLLKQQFLGIEFTIIPSVLYLNTFLTLLVAVFSQILFHRRKFLEGGEAE